MLYLRPRGSGGVADAVGVAMCIGDCAALSVRLLLSPLEPVRIFSVA